MALVKCPNALYNVCVFIKLSTAETSARTAVHTYNIHQFLEEILPVKTLIPIQIVERAYLRTTPLLPVDPPEEDSFCKGAPRGIILQLVNSCPHPVSRTLLRPLLFLSLARHPIPFSSFVLSSFSFQFLLFLFSSIKLRQRKERRNKKEKGGEKHTHGVPHIDSGIIQRMQRRGRNFSRFKAFRLSRKSRRESGTKVVRWNSRWKQKKKKRNVEQTFWDQEGIKDTSWRL